MAQKLQAITKGSQIIDEIFWELFKLLKSNDSLTELDLAHHIRKSAKTKGSDGMVFKPIVAFGKNAAGIHHWAGKSRIGKNNFLMFDYGVKVEGYCSDFTRTVFIGKPSKYHEKIYNLVLKAHAAGIKQVRINALGGEVDKAARTIIREAGFGRQFIHSTGHGVGRQIHERPYFRPDWPDRIRKNDVVTIEPGIYLPKQFGVRIEDMILVSKKPKVFSKIPTDFKAMVIPR